MAKAAKGSKIAAERPGRRLTVPLSLKFAAVIVILVGVLLSAAAALSLWTGYQEAERTALTVEQQQARTLAGRIDGLMTTIENHLAWMTEPEWRAAGSDQQRADFARMLRQFPAVIELFYIDSQGIEQLKVSRLAPDSVASRTNRANEPRFTETVKARSWFGPVYVRNGSELSGTVGVAHKDGAVTVAELDLAFLADPVKTASDETVEAFVVDGAGRLIAHPQKNLATGETDFSAVPQVAAALAAGGSGTTADAVMQSDGAPALAAWTQLPRLGWTAIVATPKAEALLPFQTLLWQTALLVGGGLLAALLVGVSLARRVALPVRQLQASTELLGEGDLSQRVDVRRRDEIGALAEKFNMMANRLQQSHRGLEAKIDDSAVGFDVALQQQSITADMLKTISRTNYDLERVLDTLIGDAVRLSEANVGAVWLRDGEAFRMVAQLGHSGDWIAAAGKAPFSKGTSEHAVAAAAAYSGEIVNVDDVSHDLRFAGDYGERPANSDERAALAVPLKHGDKVEAVFSLSRADPIPFVERQVAVVQDFADQALIAIRNARLKDAVDARDRELARSLDEQTATSTVLRAVAQSQTDSQTLLETIAGNAARLTGARYCHIALFDGELLQVRAQHGLTAEAVELVGSMHPAAPAPGSLADQAATGGKPVLVADLHEEPEDASDALSRLLGIRSAAAVPMLRAGAAVGVMTVADPRHDALSQAQLELLKTFADEAVIALDKAELADELAVRATKLSAALDRETATGGLLQSISRTDYDLDATIESLAARALRGCAADEAQIFRRDGDTLRPALADGAAVASHAGLASRVIAKGDAIAMFDSWQDPDHSAKDAAARSMLGVPLLAKGEIIGAMTLARGKVAPFDDEQAALAATLGDQTALAITALLLPQQLAERTAERDEARHRHATDVAEAQRLHAQEIEEARRLHAETVEEARQRFEAAEQQHAAEIEDARRLHAETVEEARQRFEAAEQQHAAEMEEARRLHAADVEAARQRFEAAEQQHAAEMEEARRLHAADVDEARQRFEAAEQQHAAEMDEARRLHAADVDEARQRLEATEQQHAAEMEQARRLHAQEVDEASQQHLAELSELRRLHAEEMDETRGAHAQELGDTIRTHAALLDDTRSQHAAELAEAARLRAEQLAEARRLHAQDVGDARMQRAATAEALKRVADPSPGLDAVLEKIVATAAGACGATAAILFRQTGDRIDASVVTGLPEADRDVALRSARKAVADDVVAKGTPFHAADILPGAGGGAAFPAGLGVPLRGDNGAQGALVLLRAEAQPFDSDIAVLAESFADQAAIAIETDRLATLAAQRRAELDEAYSFRDAATRLLDLAGRVSTDPQPTLDAAVATAAELCRAASAELHIADGNALRLAAAQGASGDGVAALRALATAGPVQRVGEPGAAAGAELAVPLMISGKAAGSLSLRRAEAAAFSENEIELARTLAAQAALAIQMARLAAALEARSRSLDLSLREREATAGMLATIGRTRFELGAVLDSLARSAADLCGAGMAAICLGDGTSLESAGSAGVPDGWLNDADHQPIARLAERVASGGTPLQAEGDAESGGALAVPLHGTDGPLGALVMTRPSPFNDAEIALAATLADQAVIAIANMRLLATLDARTAELDDVLRQQAAAAETLRSLNDAGFELGAVLADVADHAARLAGGAGARIYLSDGNGLQFAAGTGLTADQRAYEQANPLSVDAHSHIGRAAAGRIIVHAADVTADADGMRPDTARFDDVAAMLCVPVLREGAAVGVLALTRMAAGPFSQHQIELVRSFADQAAVAVGTVDLFDEVKARTAELGEALRQQTATASVLHTISRPAFELDGVLTTLTASAAAFCSAGGAAIYMLEDGAYHVGAATGAMPAQLVAAQHPGRDNWIGRAALDGTVIHVADAAADDEIVAIGGLAAILCVPLLRDGKAIGVFVLTRSEPAPFSERQLDLAQAFADQALIAIHNARIAEEAGRRASDLAAALHDLHGAQERLARTEKLASLGQLSTGIGLEIEERLKDLGEVSRQSNKLVDDIRMVLEAAIIDSRTRDEVEELGDTLKASLDKVVWHGRRAGSVVRNTLLKSHDGPGEHRPVDINTVVDESLGLAYHDARAQRHDFDITLEKALDPEAGAVDLYPQEITQVLLNLIANGFDATARRSAAANGSGYRPVLAASTRNLGDAVEITIRDNGGGLPDDVRARMFEPFFTTKPAGQGAGLGLSLSRDIIVKQHAGTIEVQSEPGSYTELRIVLPRGAASLAGQQGGLDGETVQSS